MWKPGQLVTLWGKVYRITKCDETARYRVCNFCAGSGNAPCIIGVIYPSKNGFETITCANNIPEGCYPKKVSK